jgi:hypothetical protein
VVADNFFTSISFAKRLLEHDAYLMGVLKNNRAGLGNKVVQKRFRRGEDYELQNRDSVKLIMWKAKKDVLMTSTRPSDSVTEMDTRKTRSKNEWIIKSQVLLDYNEERISSDSSDHLTSEYIYLDRSIK